MAVKVILKDDVPNLGAAGDVKQVAPGYFRNYLLPRGLAVEASKGQMNALQANAQSRKAVSNKARESAMAVATRLTTQTLRIPVRVGEQGRIHGSVTNKDIAEALQTQAELEIDRHKIELDEPLKSLGVHTVPIKLDQGVEGSAQVELVPEEEVA